MPQLTPSLLIAGLLSVTSLAAQDRAIAPARVAEGRLSFDARASLGPFTGVTTTVEGSMTGGAGPGQVRGCVQAPVATLATGNGRRDRDLKKSMQTDQFPTMRFALLAVEATSPSADSMSVKLIGDLTLHGVTRPDTLPATLVWRGDSLRVRSDFPVNVKDYKVGGLSKALGLLKMDEHITVHVDLLFLPDTGALGECPTEPAGEGEPE